MVLCGALCSTECNNYLKSQNVLMSNTMQCFYVYYNILMNMCWIESSLP